MISSERLARGVSSREFTVRTKWNNNNIYTSSPSVFWCFFRFPRSIYLRRERNDTIYYNDSTTAIIVAAAAYATAAARTCEIDAEKKKLKK